jgi:cytochrome c553
MDAGSASPIESGILQRPSIRFSYKLMSNKLLIAAGLLAVAAPFAASAQGTGEPNPQDISMCVGCHEIEGYRTAYPTVYPVPMIAGQSAKYIEAALIAYRRGDRSHPTMQAIAATLSDEDIANLAAYYGSK